MERMSTESKGAGGSVMLQKKLWETRRRTQHKDDVPDLTDFMTDMFFGTVDMDKKAYDLTGGVSVTEEEDDEDTYIGFDDSTRSNSSRMTEEWLEEARRVMAASSPTRSDSPTRRFGGSPRFAAAQGKSPHVPSLDRRDHLSRSARRSRAAEGFGGEILSKTVKHSRNKSDTFDDPPDADNGSHATAVHKWFSNILKPTNPTPSASSDTTTLPPRRTFQRKSRFQTHPSASLRHTDRFNISTPPTEPRPLSPPDNAADSPSRQSLSSLNSLPLSPPRNLVQSTNRRSLSSSTCLLDKNAPPGPDANGEGKQDQCLNGFLKEQRVLIQRVMNGELNAKPKIVLSGHSNSTTSMVAAICYAWLLGYRQRGQDDGRENVVVPVMNVRRSTMWKLKQASWLFYHAGLDATSLLFADEVDLESLMMSGRLNILVVGQDILTTTGEVGSQCTVLTDNYCEDAYDLLQNPVLKKLLLSGILLDTQNLKASSSLSMTRDSEAVQLLLVGLAPNYRHTLFDQLTQDQKTTTFIEDLHHNYGKPPNKSDQDSEGNMKPRDQERKSTCVSDHEVVIPSPKKNFVDTRDAKTNKVSPQSGTQTSCSSQSPTPAPARADKEASRGKNKFFLAKWFGFGSK